MVQLLLNSLISASLILLTAISFSVQYYACRYFNLAHALTITVASYICYTLVINCNLPLFPAIPIALLLASMPAILLEVLLFRKLRKNNTPTLFFLIATLGIYTIGYNLIQIFWGTGVKFLPFADISKLNIAGAYLTTVQLYTILIAVLIFSLFLLFISTTLSGKRIRAVSGNPMLAEIQGIDTKKIILLTTIIGSLTGAIAGICSALDTGMDPSLGFTMLLSGIVAMVIGGIGSYRGILASSLFLSVIQQLIGFYFDSRWTGVSIYVLLFCFLIFKPRGFFGQRLKQNQL